MTKEQADVLFGLEEPKSGNTCNSPFDNFMKKIHEMEEKARKYHEVKKDEHFIPKHAYCDPKAKVTVVVFEDGSKEICRCAKGDRFNEYAGICICLAKHFYEKSKIEKLNSKNKTTYNKVTKTRKEQK